MFSFIYDVSDHEYDIQKDKRTAKWIAKCAVGQQIRRNHYKQCLFENKMTLNGMNFIRSSNHILYINKVRKTGLCILDDKLFWKNLINGYAYV